MMDESEPQFNASWITADSCEDTNDDESPMFVCKAYVSVNDSKEKVADNLNQEVNTQQSSNQGLSLLRVDIKKEPVSIVCNEVSINDTSGQIDFVHQNVVPVNVHSSEDAQQKLPDFESRIPYHSSLTATNYCTECGKSFSCNRSFRRHMLVHTGVRPFSCKDCGKAFSRKDSLLQHERRHRRKTTHFRFQCRYCNLNFLHSLQLHNHEQTHFSSASNQGEMQILNDPNESSLVCLTPNSNLEATSDTTQNDLTKPSTDEEMYKCELCQMMFSTQSSLSYHMKTHTAMSMCKFCGMLFRFKHNKKIHILKCHSKLQTSFHYEALSRDRYSNTTDPFAASPSGKIKSNELISNIQFSCECGISFPNDFSLQKHKEMYRCHPSVTFSSSGCFYNSPGASGNSTKSVYENLPDQQMVTMPKQDDARENGTTNTILKCNVCQSRLKAPRTLPCTHSFCHDCLDGHLDRSTSSISCPTCQLVIVLPDADITSIQPNQMISTLLSEANNSEQETNPLCIVCEVSASHHCQECDAFICIKCSNAHLKLPATKEHTQMSLDEYKAKDPKERMAGLVVNCREHNSPSQFFCTSCKKLICVGCTLLKHPKGNGHDIADLSSAFQSFCTVTNPLVTECETLEKRLCLAMDEIKSSVECGKWNKYKCQESIKQYFLKVREVVDQMQEKLLNEVEDLTTAKQVATDNALESLTRELTDVRGTTLLAKHLISSSNNALALTMTSDLSNHLDTILQKSQETPYMEEATKGLKFKPCEDFLVKIQENGIGSLEETEQLDSEISSDVVVIKIE